jgi:dihydroflavonol-4-reductase
VPDTSPSTSSSTLKPILFLTGATGYLGSALLRYLHARHHEAYHFRVLIREASQANAFAQLNGTDCVLGNVLDSLSLMRATEGASVVFHVAALVSFEQKNYRLLYRHNAVGTRNVVNACLKNGVSRLIHTSSSAAIGIAEGNALNDETTSFQEWQRRIGYMMSKYLAEFEIQRGVAEGLDAVMVNPGVVIGEDEATRSVHSVSQFLLDAYAGKIPYYPTGGVGFVDVRDAVIAHEAAWKKGKTGERYINVSENLTYQNLFAQIAELGGRSRSAVALSPLLARAVGISAELAALLTRQKAQFTLDSARLAERHLFYDNTKSRTELGITYRPVKETITDLLRLK